MPVITSVRPIGVNQQPTTASPVSLAIGSFPITWSMRTNNQGGEAPVNQQPGQPRPTDMGNAHRFHPMKTLGAAKIIGIFFDLTIIYVLCEQLTLRTV